MNSEEATNTADFFLREVPNVKIGKEAPVIKKNLVKEELQFLRLNEDTQEDILETLHYIHGPDFKLNDITAYENEKANFLKKYWVGQGSLVVKGGFDFSQNKDVPTEEQDRLKNFAILRLQSYGFHQNHCIEAFEHCEGNVEDSLYVLYSKYFNNNINTTSSIEPLPIGECLELRNDEKSSLESIYENTFKPKLDHVWIVKLKLDYLLNVFHNKRTKKPVVKDHKQHKQKEKCKNILRGVVCRFGNKCRFSHEIEPVQTVSDADPHLNDHYFELEIRFSPNSRYPFEAPMLFLKTDTCLPPLMNLHICKRLYNEARLLTNDGMPCVYSVVELLQNETEILGFIKDTEINFIPPNKKLFTSDTIDCSIVKKRPTHYAKGRTNRSQNSRKSLEETLAENQRIVNKFLAQTISDSRYKKMLNARQNLPAWNLRNDILNSLKQSQIIVVSGETGCGKSTQVPQFIFDEFLHNFDPKQQLEIVVTQPRRISAIGVAERVADERIDRIGSTVGYQIRLESKVSSSTRITFCTTGILLRRLEGEPTLPHVTHIIVDEVHERSEESDFLLLILKELLPHRPDLKIILMSATLNASLFSNYFGSIPTINIPGRTFPVQQYFLEDILEITEYILEDGSDYSRKIKYDADYMESVMASAEVSYANAMPRDNIKDENLSIQQTLARYQKYSLKTCKNLYLMDSDKINNDLIEHILTWMVSGDHDHPRQGTILIFLPGIAEITSLYDQLSDHPEFGIRNRKFILLPLHSSLTSEEQSAIFRKPKEGQRKIVISTNLAETSITIDDCVFVIDAGKMKEKHFDPNRNMESLETVWVTQANALQRRGRAGRVMPGVCVHLYTSHRFTYNMLAQPIPEIHRIPLEQMILNIRVLPAFCDRDVTEVLGKFIEPPSLENITSALKRLQNAGAIDKEHSLTALGHHLAALPVDVRIGKLMLYGAIFGCVDAALTMAACLSYKNPFVSPFGKRDEANKKKQNFAVGYSDQITILVAYKKFLQVNNKSYMGGKNFARENYLSHRTLVTIADIKHQFLEFLVDIGFVSVNLTGRRRDGRDTVAEVTGNEFNKNGDNLKLLSSILCAALYPNIIKILTPSKSYIQSAAGAVVKENEAKDLKFATAQEIVFMHPSSINYSVKSFPSPYLVYQEKVRTSKVFFRDCTMIPVIPLVLFSGELDIIVQNGNSFLCLEDGWILFQVEEHKVAEMIKMLRIELYDLLEEKIKDPLLNLLHNEKGERIIKIILRLISL